MDLGVRSVHARKDPLSGKHTASQATAQQRSAAHMQGVPVSCCDLNKELFEVEREGFVCRFFKSNTCEVCKS